MPLIEESKYGLDLKRPLLSIIVPVYKTEEYLERCINSILESEYSELEIVLVDDGSPDRCPEICDNYAKKDTRIVVYHKENGGVHTAKNFGLEVAKGEYVTFCDSDDVIPVNAYRLLMQKAMETDADVVIGNIRRTKIDTGDVRIALKDQNNLSNMIGGHTGNVYKKQLLEQHHIRIGELRMGEGLCFMVQVINVTDNIEYIDDVTYDYFIRPAESNTASAMQMQYKNFALYYDDFRWRKWVIEYALNSEKIMNKYGDQLGNFCKVIDANWLYFNKKEREMCFEILKNIVKLVDWSKQKENVKGYIKVEKEKFLTMTEKKYTRYLFMRYKCIEPVKKMLKM